MNFGVAADTRALRRAVGVTAWCVLEELLLDAHLEDRGALVATTNVRRLAAQLGVSKDTAARALNRLARAGVVHRVTSARGARGALPTSSYRVDLAQVEGVTVDVAPAIKTNSQAQPRSTPRTHTRTAPLINNPQPSLFDLSTNSS